VKAWLLMAILTLLPFVAEGTPAMEWPEPTEVLKLWPERPPGWREPSEPETLHRRGIVVFGLKYRTHQPDRDSTELTVANDPRAIRRRR
jgi:hypothetical protein